MKMMVGYIRAGGRVYTIHVSQDALDMATSMAQRENNGDSSRVFTSIEVVKVPLTPVNNEAEVLLIK